VRCTFFTGFRYSPALFHERTSELSFAQLNEGHALEEKMMNPSQVTPPFFIPSRKCRNDNVSAYYLGLKSAIFPRDTSVNDTLSFLVETNGLIQYIRCLLNDWPESPFNRDLAIGSSEYWPYCRKYCSFIQTFIQ
jgi:hypothetical protein